MSECDPPQYKCSNPRCGVEIPERTATITEIFMGRGHPLCEKCYEISIMSDRGKTYKQNLKKWDAERAKLKAAVDNPEVNADAGTQQNNE